MPTIDYPTDIGFNPHTHEGCDGTDSLFLPPLPVSIHTPTKGVTTLTKLIFVCLVVSIHTPTKGVTGV